jgi:Uma2 family endonuclease
VPKYWIVDPEEEIVQVYVLGEVGYESNVKATGVERIKRKILPGLELEIGELFGV